MLGAMKTTRNIAFIALFTAVLCVLAPISIPLGTLVPISLGTLVVYIIGALLDYKKAPICIILYILIGLMGVPVFSGWSGGFAKLIGPTGGFIFGYIFGVLTQALLTTWKKDKIWMYPVAMIAGTIFIYGFGLVWFLISMNVINGKEMDFAKAFAACVTPFLLGDAIKIALATAVSFKLRQPLDNMLSIRTREQVKMAGCEENISSDNQESK
jgi:biotin transport system substrate-specific component